MISISCLPSAQCHMVYNSFNLYGDKTVSQQTIYFKILCVIFFHSLDGTLINKVFLRGPELSLSYGSLHIYNKHQTIHMEHTLNTRQNQFANFFENALIKTHLC